MKTFDSGPPVKFIKHFNRLPDYTPVKDFFWYDWGTVFYRGRLDGTAKIICVASDPGPSERIACRALVGNAGQRVQGFLRKVGITSSYVCVNGFAYALFPGKLSKGIAALSRPEQLSWRNTFFDMLKTPSVKAAIAFGTVAQKAIELWPGKSGLTVLNTYHPSYHTDTPGSEKRMLDDWNRVVQELRRIISPDAGAPVDVPLYAGTFNESDYAPIPKFDLPFGIPEWFGNDTWFRAHRGANSVSRPSPDDRHTLKWKAPVVSD